MIVVALDGPSGSGKSSTSKEIAIRAGWSYLDTGALYRAVTFIALSINSEKIAPDHDDTPWLYCRLIPSLWKGN